MLPFVRIEHSHFGVGTAWSIDGLSGGAGFDMRGGAMPLAPVL